MLSASRLSSPAAAIAAILSAVAMAQAAPESRGPPTKAELEAVCAYVATIPPADSKNYSFRSGVFDIDGSGKLVSVRGTVSDGTARGDVSEVTDEAGNRIELLPDDFSPSDYWPFGERWIIFRGRAYQLRFAEEEAGFLEYLAYAVEGGKLRLGCDFETEVKERVISLKSVDDALCAAVGKGDVAFLETTAGAADDDGEPTGKPVEGRRGTEIQDSIAVDFVNEGRKRELRLLEFTSGAGRGCTANYYDTAEAAEHGKRDSRHKLLMGLQEIKPDESFPNPNQGCRPSVPRWFTFKGRQDLDVRYKGDKPTLDRDEFHTVSTIEGGRVRNVCRAIFTKKWRLKTMGDGRAKEGPR